MEGRYEPIYIAEVSGGVLEGHSAALTVDWRWEDGRLGCHDPTTGEHIATFESERERAEAERARADAELLARNAAETRVRELEELLHRRDP